MNQSDSNLNVQENIYKQDYSSERSDISYNFNIKN